MTHIVVETQQSFVCYDKLQLFMHKDGRQGHEVRLNSFSQITTELGLE